MSIFGEDPIDDLVGDELNENIFENDADIQSEDDTENKEKFKTDSDGGSKKVEPKKRLVRNPRRLLNIDTLTGKRGIHTIENYFKDIKFAGKGHEKTDLDEILKRLQHWAHRMFPAYKFDDVLINIERLGKKKQLHNYMNRYRQDSLPGEKANEENDENAQGNVEAFDQFDALFDEQIIPLDQTQSVPRINQSISTVHTSRFVRDDGTTSTPYPETYDIDMATSSQRSAVGEELSNPMQLNTSQRTEIPKFLQHRSDLTEEQIARIIENRRVAQERLKAKRAEMNIHEIDL